MRFLIVLAVLIIVSPHRSCGADENLIPEEKRVFRVLHGAYNRNPRVRVIPNDPTDEKLAIQCEISNAWVTVYELCKESDNDELRISFALTLLRDEWTEAKEAKENMGARPPDEIYADMELLAKYLQDLRTRKQRKNNDAQPSR